MPPSMGEMSSVTCDTLFPTKVLNWHGLPTSQSCCQSKEISDQEEHQTPPCNDYGRQVARAPYKSNLGMVDLITGATLVSEITIEV